MTQDPQSASSRKDPTEIAHESQKAKNDSARNFSRGDPVEKYSLGYPHESWNYPLPDYKKNKIMKSFSQIDLVIETHLNELKNAE